MAAYHGGLQIFDLTNPTNPVRVGGFDTDGIALGVTLQGDYATWPTTSGWRLST